MSNKSMQEIMAELRAYNETHSHALSYGKYIQMLEQEGKQKAEQRKSNRGKKKTAERSLKS